MDQRAALKLISVALVLLAISSRSTALQIDHVLFKDGHPQCDNFSLVFHNGMFNSYYDARLSLRELAPTLKRSFVHERVAYNTDEPILEQLLQVYSQYSAAKDRFYWTYLSKLDGPKWFTKTVISRMKDIDSEQLIDDPDLQKQVSLYKNIFRDSVSVLAVAHSQGNFYLRNVINQMFDDHFPLVNRIAEVSVADPVPADRVRNYITLESDLVIKALPLAPSGNEIDSHHDLLGHDFVNDYLHGNPSGQDIKNLADDAIVELDDGRADPSSNRYLDTSLDSMRLWLRKLKRSKIKRLLPRYECLAISLYSATETWFGEPCTARSFNEVKKFANSCFRDEWSTPVPKKRHFIFCDLPGYSSENSMYNATPTNERKLLANHPECRWTIENTPNILTAGLLQKSLNFILHPKAD